MNKVSHFPMKRFQTEFLNFSLFLVSMSATPGGDNACGLEYKHCIFLSHSYRNTEVASRTINFKFPVCGGGAP